jgi:hypothetical protein
MSTADFSGTARTAAAFRGYVRGVMLPQLGIAAAFEMSKAIAQFGFRSFLRQMPSLRGFVSALRKGYIPDEGFARQMMVLSGFGQEKVAAYHRAHEVAEGYFGEALTAAERGANRVSHAVDVMSGNASFTSLTKQLSSMMATQQAHEYATGLRKLTPEHARAVGRSGRQRRPHRSDARVAEGAHHGRERRGEGDSLRGLAEGRSQGLRAVPRRSSHGRCVNAIQDHDLGRDDALHAQHAGQGARGAEDVLPSSRTRRTS